MTKFARVISLPRRKTQDDLSDLRIKQEVLYALGVAIEAYAYPVPEGFSWGRSYLVDDQVRAVEFANHETGMHVLLIGQKWSPTSALAAAPNVKVIQTNRNLGRLDHKELNAMVIQQLALPESVFDAAPPEVYRPGSSPSVRQIRTYSDEIKLIAVSPDGTHLLTGGTDIRLWSVQSGLEIRRYSKAQYRDPVCVGFSPCGKFAFAGLRKSGIAFFNLNTPGKVIASGRRKSAETGQLVPYEVQEGDEAFSIQGCCAQVSAKGSIIIGAGMNGRAVRFEDSYDFKEVDWESKKLHVCESGEDLPVTAFGSLTATNPAEANVLKDVTAASVSPDGRWIAVGTVSRKKNARKSNGQTDLEKVSGIVYIVTRSSKEAAVEKSRRLHYMYNSIDWSQDSSRLLLAGTGPEVEIRSIVGWKLIQKFAGHEGDVRCAKFIRNDNRVLTGGKDGTVKMWNTLTAEVIAVFSCKNGPIEDMTVDYTEEQVWLVGNAGFITEWRIPQG